MAGVALTGRSRAVMHALRMLNRTHLVASSVVVQQLRFKGNKRFKLPPAAKQQEKWVPRIKREKVEEKNVISGKDLEEFVSRVPQDDVWLRKHYPAPKYRLVDTLLMHRELASPEMHDNVDGLVVAEFELDMSTKKKTKFLSAVTGTVLFPHSFDDGVQNRVVALTKVPEVQEEALRLGAAFAGGLDLIKLIERGEIRHDDYDHVVCDADIITEVAIIKKHLKDHFPTRKKGTLGPDLAMLVNLFTKGRTFESTKESDAIARMRQAFGKLSMSDKELTENFQSLVDVVSSLKSQNLSKLITKAVIHCPPSSEAFLLQDSEIVPNIASVKQQGQSPVAETVVEEEAEEEEPEVVEDDDEPDEAAKKHKR